MNAAPVVSSSPPHAPPAYRPELTALLEQIAACSRDEQRLLLERLLRELLGDNPQGEYGIYNSDGSGYIYLLSPLARASLAVTPERAARWDEEARSGKQVLMSDIVARMKAGTFGQANLCPHDTPSPPPNMPKTD